MESLENKICPICGNEMERKDIQMDVNIGYGKTKISLLNYVCPVCGNESGDSDKNEKAIAGAVSSSLQACADVILSDFKKEKQTFSEIERKFYLPSRTLSKWNKKTTRPSAAAVALLRIIHAFPWIKEAADKGFETPEAQNCARKYYLTEFNDSSKKVDFDETSDYIFASSVIKKNKNFQNAKNLQQDSNMITDEIPYELNILPKRSYVYANK